MELSASTRASLRQLVNHTVTVVTPSGQITGTLVSPMSSTSLWLVCGDVDTIVPIADIQSISQAA